MKAIIVAAGEGTRMRPLTNDKPKQLVELQGKPLLDHILNSLPEEISALIIVVGYKGDQIRTWYGVTHAGKPITYVEQTERKGTWHALSLCEPYIEKGEKFFYLYADDLHGREGLRECIAASDKGCTMSVTEVEDPRRFGVVEIDETGKITHAEEKPDLPRSHPRFGVLSDTQKTFLEPKQRFVRSTFSRAPLTNMLGLWYRKAYAKSWSQNT